MLRGCDLGLSEYVLHFIEVMRHILDSYGSLPIVSYQFLAKCKKSYSQEETFIHFA